MFLGEYSHTIDDKGRLTIPAKYRGELAAGLVVTRGFDENLIIFALDGWKELSERIMSQPLGTDEIRNLRRRLFAGATDVTSDKQGRIVLPSYLREFAGIEGEVVIAGMFDYVEVWSADAWLNIRQRIENNNDARRWDAIGI